MASAISLPTSSSPEEMAPTLAMSSEPLISWLLDLMASTATSTALAMPLRITMGLAPAVTFFKPSRAMACASRVAVVVPSPATSLVLVATSRMSCAPMFSKASSSSTSFAMVTPSLVMRGAPYFLPRTTLRPLGPRVTLTVFASWSRPDCSFFLASSPYTICFAIVAYLLLILRWPEYRSGGRWSTPHHPA